MAKYFFGFDEFHCVKYQRNEKELKKIGARIVYLRKKNKITQSQLAFEANIQESRLRNIEKGAINTGISTLISIATSFDLSLKEFFDF